MSNSKSLLVVIDPTVEEQPAAERAAWLAKRMNATLDLFICDYIPRFIEYETFVSSELDRANAEILRQHEQRLEKIADKFRSDGLEVSVSARLDSPLHEGIMRQIAELKPDIVVKDTHYHNVIKRAFLTNTDWNLIRACPVPLLLVKPHTPPTEKLLVLAAVDPLHEADTPAKMDQWIIDAAEDLRSLADGELHVVHAVHAASLYVSTADPMGIPVLAPTKDMLTAMKAKHAAAVKQLLTNSSVAPEHVHIVEGDPREVLVNEAASLNADIVVLGAIDRGALGRLLLGSTAERIMDKIHSDILIIKPPTRTVKRKVESEIADVFGASMAGTQAVNEREDDDASTKRQNL